MTRLTLKMNNNNNSTERYVVNFRFHGYSYATIVEVVKGVHTKDDIPYIILARFDKNVHPDDRVTVRSVKKYVPGKQDEKKWYKKFLPSK